MTTPSPQKSNFSPGPSSQKIKKIFSNIASGYDVTNTVLSFGIHHLWKKSLVSWSGAKPGDNVLDCATGTGDLALLFKKSVGPTGQVTGTDFCEGMIALAPKKAFRNNLDVKFEIADVMALPYPDESFDVASISFGIRNVEFPQVALSQLHRVLRPGGVLMVLEFGQPSTPILSQAFRFYSNKILPRIGGLLTRDSGAYDYLNSSASQFPCGNNFLDLVKKSAPFKTLEFRKLSGGIAFLYKLQKSA